MNAYAWIQRGPVQGPEHAPRYCAIGALLRHAGVPHDCILEATMGSLSGEYDSLLNAKYGISGVDAVLGIIRQNHKASSRADATWRVLGLVSGTRSPDTTVPLEQATHDGPQLPPAAYHDRKAPIAREPLRDIGPVRRDVNDAESAARSRPGVPSPATDATCPATRRAYDRSDTCSSACPRPPEGRLSVSRIGSATLALVLLAHAPIPAPAQQSSAVGRAPAVGERLRVWTGPGRAHVGTLAAPIGDSVVIERRSATQLTVASTAVVQIERSLGPGRCGGRRGHCALIGALIGAAAPAALLLAGDEGVYAAVGLAPLGALIGGFAGARASRERWEAVPMPRPNAAR